MGSRCVRRAAWLALAVLAGPVGAADAPRRASPLEAVRAKALGGDMREAVRILEGVPAASLDAAERSERACVLRTFVERRIPPPAVSDAFVAEAIAIYQDYWSRVLMHELDAPDGERTSSAASARSSPAPAPPPRETRRRRSRTHSARSFSERGFIRFAA